MFIMALEIKKAAIEADNVFSTLLITNWGDINYQNFWIEDLDMKNYV